MANEHAVVLSLEDADVTDVAVPSSRRGHCFAHHAQLPLVVLESIEKLIYN